MAKGMGNGFPLGAVVTTPEIASVMGHALHFNTYGGNPVASAVGSSVLDVSLCMSVSLSVACLLVCLLSACLFVYMSIHFAFELELL